MTDSQAGTTFSNDLTAAQAERLAILLEEMGEAQQAIGKILRHGYHSWDPTIVSIRTNIDDLVKELGDVTCAIEMLCIAGDLDHVAIQRRTTEKFQKIKPYLHHQEIGR